MTGKRLFSLLRGWTKHVKSALLHTISCVANIRNGLMADARFRPRDLATAVETGIMRSGGESARSRVAKRS
jgi:hypothetical protein